jgi:hypothetical protein
MLLYTCAPGGKTQRLDRTPTGRRKNISNGGNQHPPHGVHLTHLWISVEVFQQEKNVLSILDQILAIRDDLIALCDQRQRRSRRVQAQSLAEACLEVWELAHVFEGYG